MHIKDFKPHYLSTNQYGVLNLGAGYEKVHGTGGGAGPGQYFQVDTNYVDIDEPADNIQGRYFQLQTSDQILTYYIKE